MAKKKPVKRPKAKKPVEKVVRTVKIVKRSQEEWLEHLILVSERAITEHGNSIDEFFAQQAARLRKELEELRLKNELRE
jgi:hypothetical protein